jgi:large subunit ribosomal protein L10|tara:strand:+ start:15103 stop:16407 length:1305 start_codon:yes stop_codon:yes gene_type:complete
MTEYKPHINDRKKGEVEDIKRLFNEYPIAGIVNLENLPTLQLQRIKKSLKGKIILKHSKKRFMQIAFDQLPDKKNITDLKDKLKGVPAIIFTKEDPFNLFKLLKKSQSAAAAKPGQEAPEDLKFPAGPTSFTPGPMIGELGQLGMKTEIVDGKIHVSEEKVLVKEGEIISAKIAELLAKIGIEPMKVGLNLTFTYEKGEILGKEVLGVDEEEYIQNIKVAHSDAFNLALAIGYTTPETVELLVNKGAREALALAKEANIQTSETVKEQLAEAEAAAKTIEAQVPDALAEEKKEEHLEEKVEEAIEEESKEEPAPEVKEEPKLEEPKLEEPKQEEIKEEVKEEQKDVVTNAPEEKLEETVKEEVEKTDEPEKKEPKTDEEVAQDVLRKLTGEKIKQEDANTKETKTDSSTRADESAPDMNKLINDLKDKKSKGEI